MTFRSSKKGVHLGDPSVFFGVVVGQLEVAGRHRFTADSPSPKDHCVGSGIGTAAPSRTSKSSRMTFRLSSSICIQTSAKAYNERMDSRELAIKLATKITEKITSTSHPNWTREIKSALAEIGDESDLDTRHTCGPSSKKEFLWDVVWINKSNLCLELVAESEMAGNKSVVEDFHRLLYAKSTMKLMICDRGGPVRGVEQGPKLLEQLQDVLKKYDDHVEGEEYPVFDCYGDRNLREGRQLHCYTWRASSSGTLGSGDVKFRELCPPIPYSIRE